MNDTMFIFAVVPATFCLIGFLFSLVFGPDMVHQYNVKRAAQQRELARSTPVEIVERHERDQSYAPTTRRSERRELVTH